jgi:hypothetical protein
MTCEGWLCVAAQLRRRRGRPDRCTLDAGVERQRAFDPREPVAGRLTDGCVVMRVTAVETGFAAVVTFVQLLDRQGALSKPELPLGRAAGENDMREFLDLFADGLVGRVLQSGRSIPAASRDGDEDVCLCPVAFADHLAELVES